MVRTALGVFRIHQIHPGFFCGFDWHKENDFLIASPEKALVDCLYLSVRKKNQFGHFPELYFDRSFSFRKAQEWVRRISDNRIRGCVQRKLSDMAKHRKQ